MDEKLIPIADTMGLAHEMREWAKANGFPLLEQRADELKDAISEILDLRSTSETVRDASFKAYPLK